MTGTFTYAFRHLRLLNLESTNSFLFRHLQIDFNQFLTCLGKSSEDGALLLHQIMKAMRTKTVKNLPSVTFTLILFQRGLTKKSVGN